MQITTTVIRPNILSRARTRRIKSIFEILSRLGAVEIRRPLDPSIPFFYVAYFTPLLLALTVISLALAGGIERADLLSQPWVIISRSPFSQRTPIKFLISILIYFSRLLYFPSILQNRRLYFSQQVDIDIKNVPLPDWSQGSRSRFDSVSTLPSISLPVELSLTRIKLGTENFTCP